MTRRQRRHFPELTKATQTQLEAEFEDLRARLAALEDKPIQSQVQTADFIVRPGQTIIVEGPVEGINGAFVSARETLRGQRATIVFMNANPVRLSCINGLVNGLPSVLSNAAGTFEAICDGKTGWSVSQAVGAAGVAGAPGTPGLTGETGAPGMIIDDDGSPMTMVHPFAWTAALEIDGHSGPFNAFMDVGQFVNFGLAGPTTGSPQLRSGDSIFRVSGGGALLLSAVGTAALNSTGGVVQLLTTSGGLVIGVAGGWTVNGSEGTSGQVLTSQGPAALPQWATPAAGGASATPQPPGSLFPFDDDGLQFAMPRPYSWDLSLAQGARSGPFDPIVDVGRFIQFGLADGTAAGTEQIRSGDSVLRLHGAGSIFATAAAGDFRAISSANFVAQTGGTPRLVIGATGEWTTPAGGALGNVLTHNGAGVSPTWQTPAASSSAAASPVFLGMGFDDDGAPMAMPIPLPWSAALSAGARSGPYDPTIDFRRTITFTGNSAPNALTLAAQVAGNSGFIDSVGSLVLGGQGAGFWTTPELDLTATSGHLVMSGTTFASLTTAGPLSLSGGTDVGVAVGTGTLRLTGNCFILMDEETSSAPAVAAGQGMYWTEAQTPSLSRFTDDTNNDRHIQNCVVNQSTASTVTALTTVLATTPTYTVAANTLASGAAYLCRYSFLYVRGATATAHTISVFFDVGTFPSITTLTAPVTAGNYIITVEALLTIKTTGAGGTAMGWIVGDVGNSASTNEDHGANGSSNFALATNAAIAMRGAAQMNTAVAATSITTLGGYIQPVN